MKAIYTYHFTSDGTFSCVVENSEKKSSLKEDKAIESLQFLDTIPFDRIKVYKHSIHLYKENYEIHLRDLDLFVENGLDKYIPKLYQLVDKSLKEYRYKEARKKQKRNKPLSKGNVIFGVTMGTVLMTALLSIMKVQAESESPNEIVTIETNLLNPENNFEENNDFSIPEEGEIEKETVILETENMLEENNVQVQTLETMAESVEEVNLDNIQNPGNIVYLNFEKTDDLVKKDYAFNEYRELANWCGEKWGMSPNLPLMQLTQESGGKEENLMQIVWDKWAGKPLRAFNFRDNKYETFLLTNTPTEEELVKYTCITEEDLKNPKTNMSIACVILRNSAEYMDYHIMAALQCYNLGYGNMDDIFKKVEEETGQTKDEILSDQTNISFYEYTYIAGEGDPMYLSHIFQFIDEYGDTITFKHLHNGEVVEEKIQVYNQQQSL